MSCNRCFCNSAKTLFCTKMACVDWRNFIYDGNEKVDPKAALRNENETKKVLNEVKKNKNPHKKFEKIGKVVVLRPVPRQDNYIDSNETAKTANEPEEPYESEEYPKKTIVRSSMSKLPDLPSGACVPGRIYKRGCQRCYCNYQSKATCSEYLQGACTMYDGSPIPVRQPEDVRPPFKREELKNLPSLPSGSSKCEPGKTFLVDCNTCICTEKMNLLCTKILCLSFEDINRIGADEKSGKACEGNTVTKEQCIECRCINGKTSCKQIPRCITETRTRLSKGSDVALKMQIDPVKDKCVPNGVYTDDCNRCYCQPDKTLRCTQKTCLNWAQAKALDAEYRRLEKSGF